MCTASAVVAEVGLQPRSGTADPLKGLTTQTTALPVVADMDKDVFHTSELYGQCQ